jgi:hypothetical protein
MKSETEAPSPTTVSPETSEYMREMARKSHAARKGTPKAIAHAKDMALKSAVARKKKAEERKLEAARKLLKQAEETA